MPYSEKSTVPIVFDMVDSIGLNYQESQKKTHSLPLKFYYKFEAKRLLKYERQCIQKSDVTFLFNEKERAYWASFGNVVLLPHGVREELLSSCETDSAVYRKEKEKWGLPDKFVAFIGKMNYQPNVDAVTWYVENVHSKLDEAPHLVVLGAYPTEQVKQLAAKFENITVTGFLADPYLILKHAAAVIAPMQTGGGIQNKVLEAMALGKINLLSSKAAEPISDAVDGKEYVICDTLSQYQSVYEKMKQAPCFYQQVGENAKRFILDHYTWKQYGTLYLAEIGRLRKE